MQTLNMQIVKYVDRSSYPEVVECVFSDEGNHEHIIQEKIPVIIDEDTGPEPDKLPVDIRVDCKIEREFVDAKQRNLVQVKLGHYIETTAGDTTFIVLASAVNY